MNKGKIDPGNQSPAESSPGDSKIELSQEELSRVAGGKGSSGGKLFEACATGQHIKEAKIV